MAISLAEAKRVRKVLNNPKEYRLSMGLSQATFFGKYGVTQSAGCRYEGGRAMDKPLRALIALHVAGKIDEETLASAMRLAAE